MTAPVRLVKKFGFYPCSLHIKAGPVTISPLPDLERIASDVLASDDIEKNWIYAPPQQVHHFMKGEVRIRERPYTTRVFGLPKTHLIEHAAATSEDQLDFHLWALSFFVGMRLTATEAGFLDATPVKPGRLVDFILLRSSPVRAVELAENFWKTNRDKPRCAELFAAAVHALFLSQNPQSLQFEKFVPLYMAIDACYRLTVKLHPLLQRPSTHPKRIEWMCDRFEIGCPGWADPDAPDGAEVASIRNDTLVASIRNDTLHEALFMDAPLGFAVHGVSTNQSHILAQNLPLEMKALVCRLLVALIGGSDADYVRSPVNTRQRHGLDLN